MGFWIVYNIRISQLYLLIQYVWIPIEYSGTKLTSVKLIWRGEKNIRYCLILITAMPSTLVINLDIVWMHYFFLKDPLPPSKKRKEKKTTTKNNHDIKTEEKD